jgi:predicted HAD superfamily Cof-like phosphohydrolase
MGSDTVVEQVDNILDFLYFCFGSFVEMGRIPSGLDAEFVDARYPIHHLDFKYRVSFSKRAADSIFEFMHSDTLMGQCDFLEDAARVMIRCLRGMNVDPRGLFELIHDSNMGKLWPDGKPRFGPRGKALKPEMWESPEKYIAEVLLERELEFDDDEIPF